MEMIDIYDRERNFTGLTLSRKEKLKPDQFMLYVLALIQNKDGKFLVTQRVLTKKWAAGQWEIPGGGAQAGEDSMAALNREVHEETGLDISKDECECIYSYLNEDLEGGDNYFADIYLIKKDFSIKDVKIQEEEVLDVKLADLEEIKKLSETDGFLHYKRICEALGN